MTSGLALPLQVRVPWLHREQQRPGCLSEGCWLEGWLGALSRTSSLSVSTRDVGTPRTGPLSTTFRPPGDACLLYRWLPVTLTTVSPYQQPTRLSMG